MIDYICIPANYLSLEINERLMTRKVMIENELFTARNERLAPCYLNAMLNPGGYLTLVDARYEETFPCRQQLLPNGRLP